MPDTTFANCPSLDVICVGGGLEQQTVEDDPEVLEFFANKAARQSLSLLCVAGRSFWRKRVYSRGIEPLPTGECANNS